MGIWGWLYLGFLPFSFNFFFVPPFSICVFSDSLPVLAFSLCAQTLNLKFPVLSVIVARLYTGVISTSRSSGSLEALASETVTVGLSLLNVPRWTNTWTVAVTQSFCEVLIVLGP